MSLPSHANAIDRGDFTSYRLSHVQITPLVFKRRNFSSPILLAITLLVAISVRAQSTGSIEAGIDNQRGAVIPAAKVVGVNNQSRLRRETNTDEAGLETYEVLTRIAPSGSVPIYGLGSGKLSQGIVGGYLQGQLKRGGIDESSLPVGTIVPSRQISFWQEDTWYIIGFSAAILLEALLIAVLLFSLKRIRLAERESTRLARETELAHRRLGDVVSNVPGIVWEASVDATDGTRKTTFVSQYVEKMLGYTPEEWMAAPSGLGLSLMPEEDRSIARQTSDAVLASGRGGISQFRWRAKDGRLVWAETYLNPVLNDDGKTIGLRGVTIDITDRKRAEEDLRETQDKDRAILEAVPDLMFLHTPEGQYLDYHCKDVSELLVPPEKFLGKNIREVLPPSLVEKLVKGFEHVEEGSEPYVFEYELPINGSSKCYEARMVLSAGNVLTVVRDVTARKQAEESLRQTEEKNRAILEAIPDLMFLQTREGVYLDYHANNPCDLLTPPEQFIGKNMAEVLPPELAERLVHSFQLASENGETQVVEYELPLSGKPRWFEARIVSSGDNIVTVVRDITQRVLDEEAVKTSQAELSGIIGSAMDAIITVDRSQRIVLFNESAERIFGWPAAEAMGQSLDQFIPERFRTIHRAHLQSFGEQKETHRALRQRGAVLFGLKRSGEEFPMEASISHIELKGRKYYTVILRDITDRQLAEAALRESEINYRSIFNAANDAIFVHDVETGAILDVNQRMCEMYGVTPEKARAMSVADLSSNEPPYTDREVIALIQKAATGDAQVFEWHAKKISGELFWVEVSLKHVSLRGKKCLLAVVRDITERKLALDSLCKSEERFATAFRANPQPMSLTNFETGRYLDVNDSFLHVSGYTRDEVVGHTSLELNIWDKPETRDAFVRRIEEDGCVKNLETNLRGKNGSFRVLLSSAETIEIAGEQCLLVASSDITERKLAQQALQESEARFRNMADTAPVMIWMSGDDKRCTYFNQQWLDFTGRSRQDELGDGWASGVHPDDHHRCWETYSNAFDAREAFKMEYRLRRADGAYRWLIDSGTPRFSATGDFLGYIGSCLDITDRKESEAALVNAHKELMTAHEEVSRLKNQLEEENIYLQEEIKVAHDFGDIIGESDELKYVLFKIGQVAPTDSTVLITGETGTGKELVARAIHGASARRGRPLMKVNCAALSPNLIESELFGHEKGAFTGANARKIGRFELANGATIFLDEIGELPPELQVKLLRVIQEGEIERLGSAKTIKVDARIIAATNRNLDLEVKKGSFREDLWYRLNVFPITVPPLRQRRGDIPLLVEHFVNRFAKKVGKTITSVSPATLKALRNYDWPGNVRELANVIERATINAQGSVLRISENFAKHAADPPASSNKTLEELERDYIVRVLDETHWRIEGAQGAAHILGLNASTLRTRMIKLGIQKHGRTLSKTAN